LAGLSACQRLQLLHDLLMVLLQHLCKLFYLGILRLLLGKLGEFNFAFVLCQQAARQELFYLFALAAGLQLHVPFAEALPLRRANLTRLRRLVSLIRNCAVRNIVARLPGGALLGGALRYGGPGNQE
jgi:hypothetical protein